MHNSSCNYVIFQPNAPLLLSNSGHPEGSMGSQEIGIERTAVMRIRLNYYTDPDPRKKPLKIQFLQILWKKTYLQSVTDIEQQLYIKLAKVSRGQLRSQKSCKGP